MKEEVIQKLIDCSDFRSQFSFLKEDELKEQYGVDLYNKIYKEFSDHWAYELSERIESIDIKALITDAVDKALTQKDS